MPTLPEEIDVHNYQDDNHLRYIKKRQLRSHFDIVENRHKLSPLRKGGYSARMAAQFMLTEAYNFELGATPSKNQLLGKRTAEEAFSSTDRESI